MPGRRRSQNATAVIWLADQMIAPVAVITLDGAVLHCNKALERLLADEDAAGRRRIRAQMASLAKAMRQNAGAESIDGALLSVRTSARRYRLEPIIAPAGSAMRGAIRLHRVRLPTDTDTLADRYGLTRREAAVAELVSLGFSNSAIAAELHISPHTARRHTENVFRKVGVTSRAALAARAHAR